MHKRSILKVTNWSGNVCTVSKNVCISFCVYVYIRLNEKSATPVDRPQPGYEPLWRSMQRLMNKQCLNCLNMKMPKPIASTVITLLGVNGWCWCLILILDISSWHINLPGVMALRSTRLSTDWYYPLKHMQLLCFYMSMKLENNTITQFLTLVCVHSTFAWSIEHILSPLDDSLLTPFYCHKLWVVWFLNIVFKVYWMFWPFFLF